MQPFDVNRRDRGKLCGAKVKTRENVEKKRYTAREHRYTALAKAGEGGTGRTVRAGGNPRCGGNGGTEP